MHVMLKLFKHTFRVMCSVFIGLPGMFFGVSSCSRLLHFNVKQCLNHCLPIDPSFLLVLQPYSERSHDKAPSFGGEA